MSNLGQEFGDNLGNLAFSIPALILNFHGTSTLEPCAKYGEKGCRSIWSFSAECLTTRGFYSSLETGESIRLQASPIGERGARQIQAIAALQSAAVSVRMYSVCAIIILRVLLVVRPTQALSLGKFRKVVEVDGIKSYEELRGACTTVFEEFQRPTDKLVLNF